MHEDSMRTGGKFEPGTVQQFNIKYMDKPGEEVVTVTRIPTPPPLPPEFSKSGAKVYAFVEQMPELPGGGGQQAILETIQKNFEYPTETTSEGRVFLKFIVDSDGIVGNTSVVKGLDAAADKAAILAVQKLPRFTPGKQNGQNVAVALTVPIKVVKR